MVITRSSTGSKVHHEAQGMGVLFDPHHHAARGRLQRVAHLIALVRVHKGDAFLFDAGRAVPEKSSDGGRVVIGR